MANLHGARVGLFESRMSSEIGELVRRLGGTPVLAPSVREVPNLEESARFVDALVSSRFAIVIFLTGAAASAVLREAERSNRLDSAIDALRRATIVCRGPKPTAVVRRYGLDVQVIPRRPYTTVELLEAMDGAGVDVAGREVALAHYGERNMTFSRELTRRGAHLWDVCPYEWALPEDTGPLRTLAAHLTDHVDAVAFTSQIQVRNLFAVAGELGMTTELVRTLNTDVVVASVGPVCADALKQAGVTPDVQPAEPKMGPLITALADYIELTEGAAGEP
jgi:uroporphyrinogen-III synthase